MSFEPLALLLGPARQVEHCRPCTCAALASGNPHPPPRHKKRLINSPPAHRDRWRTTVDEAEQGRLRTLDGASERQPLPHPATKRPHQFATMPKRSLTNARSKGSMGSTSSRCMLSISFDMKTRPCKNTNQGKSNNSTEHRAQKKVTEGRGLPMSLTQPSVAKNFSPSANHRTAQSRKKEPLSLDI